MTPAEQLYPYQRTAVEFAVSRSGCGLFCEQGTGKTYITAGIISKLMETAFFEGTFEGLCIVPLANVETTWVKLMSKIPGLKICRSWQEFRDSKDHFARLLLLHYEALRDKREIRAIVKAHWTLVVYDESQRIKARGSKASRIASRFSDVEHRVILSGTPIEQAPQDLWAQMRFAAPDCFGTRWADFDSYWLTPCGFMGYDREFKLELMPEFLKRLESHVHRVTKSEVLDLPPLTYHREVVPLLGQQARVYSEIEREMFAILIDGTEVFCDMAITQLVRLQQVAGGFIRTEDKRSITVGYAKERRLRVVLRRELENGPVIVFCKYREEVAACGRAAMALTDRELRLGYITGDDRKHRVATVEAFQHGEIDVLICQVRAGGVGLDLYRASTAIFYSATFSYIDFDQAVSRVHRHGQTRPVRIVLLQAQETVDSDIYSALLLKRKVSEMVLDDHRSHRRKRHGKRQG